MRILLKLSGEALAGEKKTGFDEETVRKVALQVKKLVDAHIPHCSLQLYLQQLRHESNLYVH